MSKEQFGTNTPVYHNLHYNMRGQLYDVRASNSTDEWGGELGALVNYYSTQWWHGGSGHDNNGNLLMSQTIIGSYYMEDRYSYDSLNRLTSVAEYQNASNNTGVQAYIYDRYGNRTINTSASWGTGINKDFTVNTANNRLGVPGGQSGTMSYDNAGNLTTDTYSGAAVTRAYDAENRMTSETQANSYLAGSYTYNADGQRVRRKINGVNGTETWQVYGLDGELLAEYPAGSAPGSPQKEYGYRNGQLLVEVTATAGSWGSPPAFTNNPLVAGVTEVKASHITELRAAINDLRAHISLAPYSWQYSATTNDWISANPILEMRTALDQALGAPSGGYSAGLAQNQPILKVHIQELRDRVLAAWNSGTGGADIRWLVTDHLGTPRIIIDKTGTLSGVSRHDYLPFGEELFANVGGRTTAQGYTNNDGARQKFTQKERDNETGLDFFEARYYASTQGRFTSVDPENAGAHVSDPQTWNGYAYARNNPQLYVDPDGTDIQIIWNGRSSKWYGEWEFQRVKADLESQGFIVRGGRILSRVYDDDGNAIGVRQIGTYASDMNEFGQGVAAELAGRNPAFQRFGQVGLTYMSFFTLPASEATLMTGWLSRALETSAPEAATATTVAVTAAPQAASAVKNAVTGFVKHGINSAISHDGVGVSTRAILDTLKNPIKVVPQSGGRVKVVGKEAIIILNRAGKVITTWARSTAATRIKP